MRQHDVAQIATVTITVLSIVGVLGLTKAWAARTKTQATATLAGKVTSAEEGAMEGVLVSAKKTGSTITITVVTDKDGRQIPSLRETRGSPIFGPV